MEIRAVKNMKKTNQNLQHAHKKISIENKKWILEQINHWISVADTKASIFFAIVSFSLTYTLTLDILEGHKAIVIVQFTLLCLTIVVFFLSIFFLLETLIPRLFKNGEEASSHTLKTSSSSKANFSIFFCNIASSDETKYKKLLEKTQLLEFTQEVENEIYINACICNIKMKTLRISNRLVVFGFFLLTVLIIFRIIVKAFII